MLNGENLHLELQGSWCPPSLVLLGPMRPVADRGTDTLGKNIPVSDAQKHVFKAPVYNAHLCIIIFLK